jgi:hypothetical protein
MRDGLGQLRAEVRVGGGDPLAQILDQSHEGLDVDRRLIEVSDLPGERVEVAPRLRRSIADHHLPNRLTVVAVEEIRVRPGEVRVEALVEVLEGVAHVHHAGRGVAQAEDVPGRSGSGGRIRTYGQAVNSRPLYH